MNPSTILEDVLPTKMSRWSMGLTVLLVAPSTRLPLFWPVSGMVTTEKEILLLQTLLPISIVLIGTLISLISVINEFNRWNKFARHYEVKEILQDIRVYVRKGLTMGEAQKTEWYCTNCWTDKVPSIIQRKGSSDNITTYYCPKCKAELNWDRRIAVHTYHP